MTNYRTGLPYCQSKNQKNTKIKCPEHIRFPKLGRRKMNLNQKKITFGLMQQVQSAAVSAADLTIYYGHVDPQDWRSSKKRRCLLWGSLKISLKALSRWVRIEVCFFCFLMCTLRQTWWWKQTCFQSASRKAHLAGDGVWRFLQKFCKEAAVPRNSPTFPISPIAWGSIRCEFGKPCLNTWGFFSLKKRKGVGGFYPPPAQKKKKKKPFFRRFFYFWGGPGGGETGFP